MERRPPPLPRLTGNPYAERRSAPGALSFERRQQAPSSYLERQPAVPVEPEFGYEASLKPRDLFDPHRNAAHAKWLKDELKEVREGSFALGALMATIGLTLVTISSAMPSIEPTMAAVGYPGVAFGMLLSMTAGRVLRAAIAKRKMGLSDDED